MLVSQNTLKRGRYGFFAQLVERLVAFIGLLLFSPVLLVAGMVILLEDGMPVIFRQSRAGRGGRLFTLLKLRSMRNGGRGVPITAAGDSRLLRVGKIIRKYKIDEIPQLWNVLSGDMSLVGPRPEVPCYIEMNDPVWKNVLSVRPGITDLATLLYRNEEELLAGFDDPETGYRDKILPAKLALNVAYLERRSFRTDLKLLALTVRYSFFTPGFSSEVVRRRMNLSAAAPPTETERN